MEKDSKQIERDLEEFEQALNLLKRDYEIYFSGASKLPPLDFQQKLEKNIRKYSRVSSLTSAQRFRYNSLTARFNSYLDLWTKQLRMREEGRTAPVPLETKKKASLFKTREMPSAERQLEKLFHDFLDARKNNGETVSNLTFDKFKALLDKQKEAIVSKYHCKDVEFAVVVESNQTKLKARPIK